MNDRPLPPELAKAVQEASDNSCLNLWAGAEWLWRHLLERGGEFDEAYQAWVDANGSRGPSIRTALRWMFDRNCASVSWAKQHQTWLTTDLQIAKERIAQLEAKLKQAEECARGSALLLASANDEIQRLREGK